MLIKCTECGLMISDKAYSCPHCGYPMRPEKIRTSRSNKRKRLPNGFGQISEIRGKNLRKPFRAMVSVGKSENGRPICKLLKPVAYFSTYNEAYEALLNNSKRPYDTEKNMSVADVYDKWADIHFKNISDKSAGNISLYWKKCETIYDMNIRDVRALHIRELLESEELSDVLREKVKQVLCMLFDYAIEYEYADHNYARDVKLRKKDHGTAEPYHTTFSKEEMEALWKMAGKNITVDMILFNCYAGFRPREMLEIEICNVNLEERWIIGGSKTDAGRDRTVPIHDKIYWIVEREYKEAIRTGRKKLFECSVYSSYYQRFTNIMSRLGSKATHRPHDCRVCFISMAKECSVDEYAIKRIVGHSISDITERVYTRRDFKWLKSEIDKINV